MKNKIKPLLLIPFYGMYKYFKNDDLNESDFYFWYQMYFLHFGIWSCAYFLLKSLN